MATRIKQIIIWHLFFAILIAGCNRAAPSATPTETPPTSEPDLLAETAVATSTEQAISPTNTPTPKVTPSETILTEQDTPRDDRSIFREGLI
ncbi:MAG: hypothetical protein GY805_36270, partial [Chloroflexi bacterium]|nr:hypothetical protein [Chloroflexota bacterium]